MSFRYGIFLCLTPATLLAQAPLGVKGYFFGDYFFKLAGDSSALPAQYAPYHAGDNAMQFRRIYLWTDASLAPRYAARFLLEINDRSLDNGRRYSAFVKEAWILRDSLGIPALQLQAGLIPTPTWRLAEQLWQYRSLERTLADFWGWGNAAELGVALHARFAPEGAPFVLLASLMAGSGEGTRAESDRGKKLYGRLATLLHAHLWLELYADWERRHDGQENTVVKGLLGYQRAAYQVGAEFLAGSRHGTENRRAFGMSLFGTLQLSRNPALFCVARYDRMDPDRRAPNGVWHHFAVLGLDWRPIPPVSLMPNLWLLATEGKSPEAPRRKSDVVLRMTLFVRYP